ncbi:hypothetical protein M427DRAFT_153144 [Gonapodya prolifera JEL478]|uniref:IFT121-like zinc finger domain-containing protein n=1 Tax=Gonapodya prolifera (strain JEL478) TaxID=1344416 RepID=A0A139ANL3_GONPJ|nr:hypothetical protein M427DRAFT_153144 [Gonapodya prolifera JEL478]|eukprot:KXS18330.1 hypothetical protein M427DRAFT_153144 [Gonapodya prolifera JEL478]
MYTNEYHRALSMLLQAPSDDPQVVDLAIETIGLARDDALTAILIDYLMGDTDGVPKDAKFIFKLYMSLGQYQDAARTAIIIAREEQAQGNYRAAHDLLLDNYRQLRTLDLTIPAELDRMLALLHSYVLVKILVKHEQHEKASRMLIRVANDISKFPAHVVPILTSTVVECYRSGLKRSALKFAAMVMRPEYRQTVDAKYRKKIEQIIRRPEKDERDEAKSPCPFCETLLPETALACTECKNRLPYCIVTGRHMVTSEWSVCPSCEFPALYSEFLTFLERSQQCPMCMSPVHPSRVSRVPPNLSNKTSGSATENTGPGAASASSPDPLIPLSSKLKSPMASEASIQSPMGSRTALWHGPEETLASERSSKRDSVVRMLPTEADIVGGLVGTREQSKNEPP